MPRNTFLLVILLAAFAALLAGVNISRRLHPASPVAQIAGTPTPFLTITPAPEKLFANPYCHFTIGYPSDMDLDLVGSSAAALSRKGNSDNILMTCKETIPPITIAHEPVTIASVAATLYHSALQDGSPQDFIIVKHPNYNLQIYIGGYGQTFDYVLNHLTFN